MTLLRGTTLGVRLAVAAGVLFLEKSVLNLFVDFTRAQDARGLGAALRVAQHWGLRFLVSLAVALVLFGYLSGRRELARANAAGRGVPVRIRWLALHLVLVVPLAPLSMNLYGDTTHLPLWMVVMLWLLLAGLAAVALLVSLAPWPLWRRAAHALGIIWGYSTAAGAGSVAVMGANQELWSGMSRVTFEAVYRLLEWFIPTLRVDPSGLIIDTGRFAVAIAPVCSGVEGMGLMLAFCTALLILFRKEFLFPRAFILLPISILLSFALNVVRIGALVLIGSAGYPGTAIYGFHSQAGWMAFNAAAAAIAFLSLRSRWLTRTAADGPARRTENPTAAYLLPFLVLLAAGMVSRATSSSGLAPLYWLPLLAAGLALAYCATRLGDVDWRCSWRGAAGGVAAFLVWSAAARLLGSSAVMPFPLSGMAPVARTLRVGAELIVSIGAAPIAEELAFRGYLLRRLVAADFQSVSPDRVGAWPLLLSSLAFGLCHGAVWLPATLSGMVFGLVFVRTRRLGEAAAAHAAANALLALSSLSGFPWAQG